MPNPKLETYKNKATSTVYDLTDANAQASLTAILDGTSIDSFADVESALADKVDVVSGKGLSENDYTDADKAKVDGAFPRSEQAVLGAGNFLIRTPATSVPASITLTDNDDDTLLINGNVSSSSWINISANQSYPKGNFYLKGCPSGGDGSNGYALVLKDETTNTQYFDVGNGIAVTIDDTNVAHKFTTFIKLAGTASFNNLLFEPALVLSLDTPYAPHAMTNKELTENVNDLLANLISKALTITTANYTGDLDELDAGIRYCTNATTHNPNNAWGYCLTIKNPTNAVQLFIGQATEGMWYRRYASNAWQAWKTVTLS